MERRKEGRWVDGWSTTRSSCLNLQRILVNLKFLTQQDHSYHIIWSPISANNNSTYEYMSRKWRKRRRQRNERKILFKKRLKGSKGASLNWSLHTRYLQRLKGSKGASLNWSLHTRYLQRTFFQCLAKYWHDHRQRSLSVSRIPRQLEGKGVCNRRKK